MGAKYDPPLVDLCTQVRTLANSTLHLPQSVTVRIRPQAVMRSVLGHLAAQGVQRYAKGPITEPLRDYLLATTQALPPQIRLYYWLYPYRTQILVRDAVKGDFRTHLSVAFWLMKFFPLAFMVTFDEPPGRLYPSLGNLDVCGADPFGREHTISLPLRPLIHRAWPEHPTDSEVIVSGPQAVTGRPLTRIVRT